MKELISIGAHYVVAGGLTVCSILIGQPWSVAFGVITSVGFFTILAKNAYNLLDYLELHPERHPHSPNLGKILETLSSKMGTDEKIPVLSSKLEFEKLSNSSLAEILNKNHALKSTFPKVPNASAINIGWPRVVVTDELLQIMEDDEEHAVIAREFAHIRAKHSYKSIPLKFFALSSQISNNAVVLLEMVSAGALNLIGVIVGSAIIKEVVNKAIAPPVLTDDDDNLSLPNLYKKKRFESFSTALNATVFSAGVSYFNPTFFPIWIASQAIRPLFNLSEKSLSRCFEYQADKDAVEKFDADPLALISALKKLDALKNRSLKDAFNGELPRPDSVSKIWEGLNATHPPIEQRVAHLAEIASKRGVPAKEINAAISKTPDIQDAPNIPYEIIHAALSR